MHVSGMALATGCGRERFPLKSRRLAPCLNEDDGCGFEEDEDEEDDEDGDDEDEDDDDDEDEDDDDDDE